MMRKSTTIVAIASAAFCLSALGALLGLSYLLTIEKEKLDDARHRSAITKSQGEQLASLVRLVDDTAAHRAELDSRVLADEGVVDFLSLIESIAREQGVLLTMTVENSDISPLFESLALRVSLEGTYGSLLHTLRMFEVLPYQSSISNVSFERAAEGDEDLWHGSFMLSVTKRKES